MSRVEPHIRFFGPDHNSQSFADEFERFKNSQLSDVDLARRRPTEGSAAHKSYLREIERRKKAEK